jgi:hypothetical protein
MAYTAPSGWIETRPSDAESESTYRRFHQQQDCIAIQPTSSLAATARPYAIQRCKRCAG